MPVVFVFNKRDASDVVPAAELADLLDVRGAPFFETIATSSKAGAARAIEGAAEAVIMRHRARSS